MKPLKDIVLGLSLACSSGCTLFQKMESSPTKYDDPATKMAIEQPSAETTHIKYYRAVDDDDSNRLEVTTTLANQDTIMSVSIDYDRDGTVDRFERYVNNVRMLVYDKRDAETDPFVNEILGIVTKHTRGLKNVMKTNIDKELGLQYH